MTLDDCGHCGGTGEIIRALVDAATPGEWYVTDDLEPGVEDMAEGVAVGDPSSDEWAMVVTTPGNASFDTGAVTNRLANATFIAAARTVVPELLDELAQARGYLKSAMLEMRTAATEIGIMQADQALTRLHLTANEVESLLDSPSTQREETDG